MLSVENLDSAFKVFDSTGSGKITASNLREILGGDGNTSDEVWNRLLTKLIRIMMERLILENLKA